MSRTTGKAYGEAGAEVLAFIIRHCQEHGGNFPTVREIQDGCHYTSTSSVFYHIQRLAVGGKIKKVAGHWTVVGARWVPPPAEPADPKPDETVVEVSADDDPSGQGQAGISSTRGRAAYARLVETGPRAVRLSPPVVHRLRLCAACGIAQPAAYRGATCVYCRSPLAEVRHAR